MNFRPPKPEAWAREASTKHGFTHALRIATGLQLWPYWQKVMTWLIDRAPHDELQKFHDKLQVAQ